MFSLCKVFAISTIRYILRTLSNNTDTIKVYTHGATTFPSLLKKQQHSCRLLCPLDTLASFPRHLRASTF